MAGRHGLRRDINQLSQSLSYRGWLNFCAAFNLSPGTSSGANRMMLTYPQLAMVHLFFARNK